MKQFAKTQTNFFIVTDEEKFKKIITDCCADADIEIVTSNRDNVLKYGFECDGTIDGFCDEKGRSDESLKLFYEALQTVLPDDDAVIIMEIGIDDRGGIYGHSIVITKGQTIGIASLRQASVKRAQEILGLPDYNTQILR